MVNGKGNQEQISVILHTDASWSSESQKPLHWGDLWFLAFPRVISSVSEQDTCFVNNAPWTHRIIKLHCWRYSFILKQTCPAEVQGVHSLHEWKW